MTMGAGISREGSLEGAGLHYRPLQVELDTGQEGGGSQVNTSSPWKA